MDVHIHYSLKYIIYIYYWLNCLKRLYRWYRINRWYCLRCTNKLLLLNWLLWSWNYYFLNLRYYFSWTGQLWLYILISFYRTFLIINKWLWSFNRFSKWLNNRLNLWCLLLLRYYLYQLRLLLLLLNRLIYNWLYGLYCLDLRYWLKCLLNRLNSNWLINRIDSYWNIVIRSIFYLLITCWIICNTWNFSNRIFTKSFSWSKEIFSII